MKAYMCGVRSWISHLADPMTCEYVLNKLRATLFFLGEEMWANQVSEKTYSTTWKVTEEIVSWKLSTKEGPEIPSWWRFSEDKDFVTCLK